MITPKAWGWEDEIVNVEYCGKRIFVKEQYRSSIHKHTEKDEVLMVASGLFWFEAGQDPNKMHGQWMQDNERIRIRPGEWHRFTAMRNSMIFEMSTHHEDADTTRYLAGGKVSDDEYRALLAAFFKYESQDRVITPDRAGIIASTLRSEGRKIGMVNGCFDLMHLGHIELLREARFRCEVLFVAVNSDVSVETLKGKNRPYIDEAGRMGMVEACRYVDYVVEAQGKTCVDIAIAIKPDVYVTTIEYGTAGPEAKEVAKNGGKIELVDLIKGYNTTAIAKSIKAKS